MLFKHIKNTGIAVACFVAMPLLFSCNKQPIGPTGPDEIGAALPGQYLTFKDFRALYTGAGDVTIPAGTKKMRGVVISNSANEAAGNVRLQDESGYGIYVYTAQGSPNYSTGTVLEIDAAGSGVLTSYNGDLELKNVPQAKVVQLGGTMTVTPRVATVAQIVSNRDTWASSLVTINNITSITQASSNATGITYNITDASGTMTMFVRAASGIAVNTNAKSITGYVSIYNTLTQIGIRTAADLQ